MAVTVESIQKEQKRVSKEQGNKEATLQTANPIKWGGIAKIAFLVVLGYGTWWVFAKFIKKGGASAFSTTDQGSKPESSYIPSF